jgi:hypothetical protein
MCGKVWNSVEDFLDDPEIDYIGDGCEMRWFNHVAAGCETTLVLFKGEDPLNTGAALQLPVGKHKILDRIVSVPA